MYIFNHRKRKQPDFSGFDCFYVQPAPPRGISSSDRVYAQPTCNLLAAILTRVKISQIFCLSCRVNKKQNKKNLNNNMSATFSSFIAKMDVSGYAFRGGGVCVKSAFVEGRRWMFQGTDSEVGVGVGVVWGG